MTIIEVMVVVAVVGLLAGGLIMGLGAGRQAQLMRATNQVAGTVRFAFNKARVTGTYYRLHLDFEKRSFTLQSADERMYMPSTDRDGSIREYDEDEAEDKAARDEKAAESYFSSVQGRMMGMLEGEDMNPYAITAEKVPRRRPPLFLRPRRHARQRTRTRSSVRRAVRRHDDRRASRTGSEASFPTIAASLSDGGAAVQDPRSGSLRR